MRVYFILSTFLFLNFANAQDKPVLNIVGEYWYGVTNVDGTGTYWDIVREALGDKYELNINTTSWVRANVLVKTGKADVLVGVYKNADKSLLYSNHHIDTEYPVYVLYDSQNNNFSELKDLAHKVIAGRTGWGLENYLPKTTNFYGVDNIHNISNLIVNERIDGALTYSYNLLLADPSRKLKYKEVIPELPLYLTFTPSDKGEELKRYFDKSMDDLVAAGTLSPFFESFFDYQHANLKTKKQVESTE